MIYHSNFFKHSQSHLAGLWREGLRRVAVAVIAAVVAVLPSAAGIKAIDSFLDRIGGEGASKLIVTELTPSADGCESFTIWQRDGCPLVSGTTLSAITTGIGWYLNHHAGINLAWNRLTTDLAKTALPVPSAPETHESRADYRYYLNYCTFSYTLSTYTWDRWQKEIDWMALHGINMPLQIVGLDVVWRDMLTSDYGYTPEEANAFVAGPCFQAWWGMNNMEGWGGPNPDWWYDRQALLARLIIERERELGIEPVLPGFSGMVPSNFTAKTGVPSLSQGKWCGFVRPLILDPASEEFASVAAVYYKHLHNVMGGRSRYYSMDPFHEGADTRGIDVPAGYHAVYEAMEAAAPATSQWVAQQWSFTPEQWKLVGDSVVPRGRLVMLDLFSDGLPRNLGRYNGHESVWCALPNFGARTGIMGRFNTIVNGYFDAVAKYDNLNGVGATPEGTEQTPVIYDLLFEMPWTAERPDPAQWMADYARRRYGTSNASAAKAWEALRVSALDNTTPLQGPHEAVICARPALEVNTVSSWGGTEIFYEPSKMYEAAYALLDAGLGDNENYEYDLADVSRQALTDYSKALLDGLREAREAADTALFNERKELFLKLILDIDRLLNTNANFMIGPWTEGARAIADEIDSTTEADREWLEKTNARTLVSTWGPEVPANRAGLRDYSYREKGGMLRDYYYARWKKWFDAGMTEPEGGWFAFEWDWAHNDTTRYPTEPKEATAAVAAELLPAYIARFKPASADASAPEFYLNRHLDNRSDTFVDRAVKGKPYTPAVSAPDGLTVASVAIGKPAEGAPADAPRPVIATLSDGTTFTYSLILDD